jgi:hypothetical protein
MSGDKPNEFRVAQAKKHQDSRYVTAEDELLITLEEVREAAKTKGVRMVAVWIEYDKQNPEGPADWHSRYANLTKSQVIAYLGAIVMELQQELLGK